jgi:dihydroflavonol-4-reductase
MIAGMKAIVTGANGHIGSRLVRRLVDEGHEVRALVRAQSDLRSLDGLDSAIEMVRGDVLDPESLVAAMRDRTHLFHTATLFSHDLVVADQIHRTAVEGTRNVLLAAARAGTIERVVHTSSCVTLGSSRSPDEVRDESCSAAEGEDEPYRRAKIDAERLAFATAAELGLPLVVVNPAVVLGPGDHRPTPSNGIIVRFVRQASPIYWAGGRSHVDVDDVAEGQLRAALRGRAGERYILAGENQTIQEFASILFRLTGLGRPQVELGGLGLGCIGLTLELAARLRGRTPGVTRTQAAAAYSRYMYFSSAKAERELGYHGRRGEEVLVRAVAWFLTTGLLPPARSQRARAFFQCVVGAPPEEVLSQRTAILGFAIPLP